MKRKLFSFTLTLLLSLWTAMAQVTVSGSASQDGVYTTLGAAITAIGTSQTGNNITVAISASTTEASTGITIGAGTWSSLKIYPTATATLAAAANTSTTPFITLSGANNVTIDGRLNQSGVSSLTINNVSTAGTTAASTILFDNNAQNNTIKYCTISGGQSGAFGIISFSGTATASNGNGLNTIDHNVITPFSGGSVLYGLYSIGNTAKPNIGNQITNNEFKNILNNTLASNALYIAGGITSGALPQNDNFTISGNSFYNSSGFGSVTAGGSRQMIAIGSGTNSFGGSHTITDNFFGSNAANCSGTNIVKYNQNSNFTAIYISTSPSTVNSNPTSIQNNTIQKIQWQNGTSANFIGIAVTGTGNANIGTVTGNTFGDNTTTGSINVSGFATGSNTIGIQITTTGNVDCQNNKIGSILNWSGTLSTNPNVFYGIYKSATAGTTNISNNIIGSTSIANSIYSYVYKTSAYSGAAQTVYGIDVIGTGTVTVSNNTIANITNYMATGGNLFGMYVGAAASSATINANLVHSLGIGVSAASGPRIVGIQVVAGTNTVTNNIVTLGAENQAVEINGINEYNSLNSYIYHNTVYLRGTPTSAAFNSECLISTVSTANRNIKNNVLVNTRSNGGAATGKHYAVYLDTNTGLTEDYNDYFINGTNGVLGYVGGDKSTLTLLQTATSGDANSINYGPTFANAGGTLATDYIPLDTPKGVSGTGVTKDYLGADRIAPSMGAFEVSKYTGINNANTSELMFLLSESGQFELKGIDVETGKVYSSQGKLVKSFNTNTFSITNLSKGVYMLTATDKNGRSFSKKFIF